MSDLRDIDQAAARLDAARGFLHIDERAKQLAELDKAAAKPGFWDDADHAAAVTKQASTIREVLADFETATRLLEDARTAADLAEDDPDFEQEALQCIERLQGMNDRFEIESWFAGEFDEGDCIISINPGSGGLEAQDWTEMLFRMYKGYAESKGWSTTVLEWVPSPIIGVEHASLQIEGRFAFGMLKSEAGVHRLVRISPTDKDQRRHTTFAGVEVVPVLPDTVEVNLDMEDVQVDVYRSSGPGGQGVNTTDSAVRLTHKPTGIVVTCQNERSQLQNKEVAFRILRAKLYELEQRKREEELAALTGTKLDNSFGSQIRNYVLYPYQMVKDVRSGWESGNPDAFLGGDIEECMIEYHRWRVSQEPHR